MEELIEIKLTKEKYMKELEQTRNEIAKEKKYIEGLRRRRESQSSSNSQESASGCSKETMPKSSPTLLTNGLHAAEKPTAALVAGVVVPRQIG